MSIGELLLRHCAALKASATQQQVGLELLVSQLSSLENAIRAELASEARDGAVIQIPDTCLEYKEQECARRCDDALIEMGGMGGSDVVTMCRGCGRNPRA